MARIVWLVLLLGCLVSAAPAAEPRKFAEPLNVAAEYQKIVTEFPDEASKAARDEALSQLAAAAEAAQSTDYSTLLRIYVQLRRPKDMARMQDAMFKKQIPTPRPVPTNDPRQARSNIPKPPATTPGSTTPATGTPATGTPPAQPNVDPIEARRRAAGLPKPDSATNPAPQPMPAATTTPSTNSTQPTTGVPTPSPDPAAAQRRNSLGQSRTEVPANPTAQPPADPRTPTTRASELIEARRRGDLNPAAGTPTTAPPATTSVAPGTLNVRIERRKIYDNFSMVPYRTPQSRQGPDYEKFVANRTQALAELVARAEAAKSTDHLGLSLLYSDLERFDDAAREAQADFDANPNSPTANLQLMDLMCRAHRADGSLAACRRWLAEEVPVAGVVDYVKPVSSFPSTIRDLAILLSESGRADVAEQILDEVSWKLSDLFQQCRTSNDPMAQSARVAISNNLISVDGFRRDVDNASRSELRKKLDQIMVDTSLARLPRPGGGRPDTAAVASLLASPEAQALLAERAKRMAQLLDDPATAQSSDLPTLIKLYATANHLDDGLRVFRQWIAQDVSLARVRRFNLHLEQEVRELVKALSAAQRLTDAWQTTVDVEFKLDRLLAAYDQGPAPRGMARVEITNAAFGVEYRLQGDIAAAESKLLAAATGPVKQTFSQPLRPSTEIRRIQRVFAEATGLNTASPVKQGPVYDQALAQKTDAFRQLAAALEATGAQEHFWLLQVYAESDRPSEAQREARTVLADPAVSADPRKLSTVVSALSTAGLTDDALTAARRLAEMEISLSVQSFLQEARPTINQFLALCAKEGQIAVARQFLDQWDSQLNRLQAKLDLSGTTPGEKAMMGAARDDVAAWRKKLAGN